METIVFLVIGALLGGFVMGLVGFGTGLVALGLWLFVAEPSLAVPLVAICSLATTAFTLSAFRHAISLRRLAPFLLGALAGLPIGVALLTRLDPGLFKLAMGVFLILYTLFRLLLPDLQLHAATRAADLAVGFAGGVLGGFASIPGTLSTLWCGLRGWSKDEQRAVYQPYNQIILLIAFALYARAGLLTAELGIAALFCLPAALIGMGVGMAGYKRLGETQFQRIVLVLLLGSGIMLVALNLFGA